MSCALSGASHDDSGNQAPSSESFGQYELLGEIGSDGAMGIVYRARHSPTGRIVAIKMLRPERLRSANLVQRFQVEVQAVANLDHEHVLPIYEIGEHEGRNFYTMRLAEHGSLGRQMADGKWRAQPGVETAENFQRRVATLMARVTRGVHHAHERGVLHRDLKPANILLDETNAPYVADFGLAKRLHADSGLTQSREILGTPSYMAPEQASEGGKRVTARSDIWSLGVILYELLTGDRPFHGEDPLELLKHAQNLEPEPPRKLNPALNEDLATICLKCLEKDPIRRYSSAQELADDLERWLRGEPIHALPIGRIERFRKLVSRNPVTTSLVTLIAATLLSGISGIIWQWRNAENQRRKVTTTLALNEFERALDLVSQSNRLDALAYLAKSLSRNPTNDAAQIRLLSLLTYQPWAFPVASFKVSVVPVFLDMSPDSIFLMAVMADNSIHILNTRDGRSIAQLNTDGAAKFEPWTARFSADSKRIIVPEPDDRIPRIWQIQSGTLLSKSQRYPSDRITKISSDGETAVNYETNAVSVWNTFSGELRYPPLLHTQNLSSVLLSPDSSKLITTTDVALGIFDAHTGHNLFFIATTNDMYARSFSSDGNLLLTTSSGNSAAVQHLGYTLRVWDLRTRQCVANVANLNKDSLGVVSLSRDGSHIYRISTDDFSKTEIHVWKVSTGEPVGDPFKCGEQVLHAWFSSTGKRVIPWAFDGDVRVWNATTGLPISERIKHGERLTAGPFSTTGDLFWTASSDGSIIQWKIRPNPIISEPLEQKDRVFETAFSPDGHRLLTCGVDFNNVASVWDIESCRQVASTIGPVREDALSTQGFSKTVLLQFSPDGKSFLVSAEGTSARVWDTATGQPLSNPLRHSDRIVSAEYNCDGKSILTASRDKTACIWDARAGIRSTPPLVHDAEIGHAEFSSDGKKILTATTANALQIWDAKTGKSLVGPFQGPGPSPGRSFFAHEDSIPVAHFNLRGDRILVCVPSGSTGVLDANTGKQLGELREIRGISFCGSFSPSGTLIVTYTTDGFVRVWDSATLQPLTQSIRAFHFLNFLGEPTLNSRPRFNPNGSMIASIFGKEGARILDTKGNALLELPHDHRVLSMNFSPNGRHIVTTSVDSKVRLWDIPHFALPIPPWFFELVEAVSGQVVNDEGLLQSTSLDRVKTLQRLRAQLKSASSRDDWSNWGAWFLDDSQTRPISPFSKVTVADYVQRRIDENTVDSLNEALRVSPNNKRAHQLLERR